MAKDVPTSRRAVLLAIFIAFGEFTLITVIQCSLNSSLQEVRGCHIQTRKRMLYISNCNPPTSLLTPPVDLINQHSVAGFLFGYDMGVISVRTRTSSAWHI